MGLTSSSEPGSPFSFWLGPLRPPGANLTYTAAAAGPDCSTCSGLAAPRPDQGPDSSSSTGPTAGRAAGKVPGTDSTSAGSRNCPALELQPSLGTVLALPPKPG